MKSQYCVELGIFAPADEIVKEFPDGVAIDTGTFLDDDLIEAEPDVVHAERCDIFDVAPGDVSLEVFKISDREREPPFGRQNIEALVVGEPAADAHTAGKTLKFRHFLPLF